MRPHQKIFHHSLKKVYFCTLGKQKAQATLFSEQHKSQNIKRPMDNNIKKKIDDIVNEISNINDLNIKHAVLTYMEQQAGYLLWQMEDEKHIDNDSHNV